MTLLILLLVLFPVLAVAGFAIALDNQRRVRKLEGRLAELRRDLAVAQGAIEDDSTAASRQSASSEGAGVYIAPDVRDRLTDTNASEPSTGTEPDYETIEPEDAEPEEAAAQGEPEAPPESEEAPGEDQGPAPPSAPPISLEERFGTQWVVWAGGIALALGGFFLVRYSIEQGWFGPAARIILAGILAAVLIVLGEWTRRNDVASPVKGVDSADIPSILTAVGTIIAYGDIYAAYALHGFIGPLAAFVLLGIVAVTTLLASLLHGPALAGLGLVGAFVAPAIVATETPNYWALYLYLAFVSASAYALASARTWRWLVMATVLFAFLWTFPGMDESNLDILIPHLFHLIIGFCLAAIFVVPSFLLGPRSDSEQADGVSTVVLSAYLLSALLLALGTGHDLLALWAFGFVVAFSVALAWRAPSAIGGLVAASGFTVLLFWHWSAEIDVSVLRPDWPGARTHWSDAYPHLETHVGLATALAALFGLSGFFAQLRESPPKIKPLWAAVAVCTAIALLVAVYYRLSDFDTSLTFAAVALVLAGLFTYATEMLAKRPEENSDTALGTAWFAIGAVAALALSLTMALEKGWLTVALALMVPGIAWIADKQPIPILRSLAGILTGVVLARLAWEPRIVGDALGETPIFNWLLYGYGIPAVSFWVASLILRRDRRDHAPALATEAAALLCTALLFVFQIRHLAAPHFYTLDSNLLEVGLDVVFFLAFAAGLERIRLRRDDIVLDIGAGFFAACALVLAVLGLGYHQNPVFTGEPISSPVANLLMLSYGLPAAICVVYRVAVERTRPKPVAEIASFAAVTLALVYLSLEVRRIYQGPVLSGDTMSDAELYTYSVVWLLGGVALLALGIWRRSLTLRAASAAVVVLTVFKVFLIDMSGLTGIYQALSFLGLGAVLLAIGWFYQRLLFPKPLTPQAET